MVRVSGCYGDHCWFAFVLWRGYCSVSFQPFVLRHLVMAPVRSTKKLLKYSVVLVPAKEKE